MKVTFGSPALAALCNSEQRLAKRWGLEAGRTLARRLLDLAAVDAAHLRRLPDAEVTTNGTGETTIAFGAIVIQGKLTSEAPATRPSADRDRMVITRVAVERRP